jgi:hypothetical protein
VPSARVDDAGAFEAMSRDFGLGLDRAAIRNLIARKSERFASLIEEATVLFPGARASRDAAAVPLAIASGALRHGSN